MNYYVRLVQGKGVVSRLIEFKQSDWPSHVELIECFPDDTPRNTIGSRYPAGVQFHPPDAFPLVREEWYTCPVPSDAIERAWNEMVQMVGHKYDWRDILGIAADTDWHTDGRYICSEAVASAFEVVGAPLFHPLQPVRRIWPRDFLLTPRLKLYKVVTHQ